MIIDETTSALSKNGRDILYGLMEKMKSLYIGNGISFIVKELKVVSVSGEPFNAYFELQNGILSYISDKELSIITQYDLKKQIIK